MNNDEKRDVIQAWIDAGQSTCAVPSHPKGVSRVLLPGETCTPCSQRFKLGNGP